MAQELKIDEDYAEIFGYDPENTDKRYCMLYDSEPGTFNRALRLARSRNAIPTQKCHHAVMVCSSWTKRDDALPDGKNLTDFLDHP